MEFLKTCNTNAQAIGDFEAVAFQAFSVQRKPTQPSTRATGQLPSEDVRVVEAELWQQQQLAVQGLSRPWLWLFRATSTDTAEQQLPLPVVDGYVFHREHVGLLRASELARPPLRHATPNPITGATNSPSTPGPLKGSLGGGARPVQGNVQPAQAHNQQHQTHDSYAIYELFMSSVVALVSYHMVKDHKAIALNYRTFISRPTNIDNFDDGQANTLDIPHLLTNISVYWASSGTLLVSTCSVSRPGIRCLDGIATDDDQNSSLDKCIRVAPNGLLAKVVSFNDGLDDVLDDTNRRFQRKRLKVGPVEQAVDEWKSAVVRWLGWKGYSIPVLSKRSSWVRIRIGLTNTPTVSSPVTHSHPRDILWPRALCFLYEEPAGARGGVDTFLAGSASHRTDALHWFDTTESPGFKDPIDVAQHWFLGKPERDRILEARRRTKKAEEDAMRAKEENHGLYPSSPLNSRTGAYGDLQAASGVYPTPPDGIVPGTVVSSSDTPSLSGTTTNVILALGGNNPVINLSAPVDRATTDSQHQPLTSPEFPLQLDHFPDPSNNDDLFGEDMDDDGFEGNGVTEDDFNFFDERDNVDIDMPDASPPRDAKPMPTKRNGKEKTSEPDMSEEMQDPLAALEDALATASSAIEENIEKTKVKQPNIEQAPAYQKVLSPSIPSANLVTAPVIKALTSPLSPRHIQQTLLPSPKDNTQKQTAQSQITDRRQDSIFDPISFNRKLSLSDAKYHEGRFSISRGTSTVGEIDSSGSSRRYTSLRDVPLMTNIRLAVGIAAVQSTSEVASLARDDSDSLDSMSDTSSIIEEEEEEEEEEEDMASVAPSILSTGFTMPIKRKFAAEGNATPLSVTSFADSFAGEVQDAAGLHVEESCLVSFEPTIWDWSLTHVSSPTTLATTNIRYSIPMFSPLMLSMPNTPTSQPDLSIEPLGEKPLSEKDSIAVAQIVTEQIVKATLDVLPEDQIAASQNTTTCSYWDTKFQGVVKKIFPQATDCSVSGLVSVPDVFPIHPPQAKGQQPLLRKLNEASPPGSHMHPINPPHIRIRRADAHWDILSPALAFWEPLGLSPCSPAKNIVAFCIYPHSDSLRPCLESFLLNIQIAYDNCKLGSHTRLETVPEYESGLVPCRLNSPPTSARAAFKVLRETCVQLGKLLAVKHTQMRTKDNPKIDAFVIYMIDPFGDPSATWELCSAFWTLFQAYGQGPPGRPDQVQKPDLVLQIVPMKYIASLDEPVVLDSGTYSLLAREVYDRCPPSAPSEDKTPLGIFSAPSFQLEEGFPKGIPFKLSPEPPQDLLRENSYMHVGYAVSLDGTWITAAWTDTWGKSQAVVSYSLGTRAFAEIAKEIWQTTVEILQARRVFWRVCIAKAGVMDKEELDTWVYLASCPAQVSLFFAILTVDVNPPLRFTPTMPTHPAPSNTSGKPPSNNTPGSTPQPGVSPDTQSLTPAATPSADTTNDPSADPEARLVDTTDESWGIMLAHRLHNSNSTVEFRPALISGLLVKRGETYATSASTFHQIPDPERGPIVIGVNILWIGMVNSTRAATSPFPPAASGEGISPGAGAGAAPNPMERGASNMSWTPTAQSRATAETLLREVLAQYRGLGLLAKLKGMRGTRHGTVPWHVAAAVRGVNGLSRCV
ncbi:mediator complex subunit 13 C-terminal-domain-containing protein [Massariosphaeria phaeospora]|uniref:Mediator of RNA polymerase II transcription subunit 13 n=1 Tax=Massariosphaeria phaeospora TaxID=100035 RepID=A0A7C8I3Z3_9PLEO|nr:mediator complex subunit 13 C-terminal-domain-containing protein [Massariosphaeria phaeospora]